MAKVNKEFRADSIKTTLIFNGVEFAGVYNTTGEINKPQDLFDFEFKKRYDIDEDNTDNGYEYFMDSSRTKSDVLIMLDDIENGSFEDIQAAVEELTEIEKGI